MTPTIKTPKRLIYKRENNFYRILQQRINAYFKENDLSKLANRNWYAKAFCLLITYVVCYVTLLTYGQQPIILFTAYGLIGILTIIIGLNIGHDAAHNTITKNKRLNQVFFRMFDLMGANSYLWKIRHVYAHHPYPNIIDYDADIQQSKLVRIFPSAEFKNFHRFQHIYTPILMVLIYTMNWLLIRDFKDFTAHRFGKKVVKEHPKREVLLLVFFKLFYISNMLLWPYLALDYPFYLILLGFVFMNILSGIVISIALVSAHIGDEQDFPVPNEKGEIDYSWAEHQIASTADFCTKNPVMNLLFGGFNHHVIHHLFPKINHIHYPNLTPILIETAKEYNITYQSEDNILKVFKSHINLLKREGYHVWLEHVEV